MKVVFPSAFPTSASVSMNRPHYCDPNSNMCKLLNAVARKSIYTGSSLFNSHAHSSHDYEEHKGMNLTVQARPTLCIFFGKQMTRESLRKGREANCKSLNQTIDLARPKRISSGENLYKNASMTRLVLRLISSRRWSPTEK